MEYRGTAGNDVIDQAVLKLPDNVDIYGEAGDDTITMSNGKMIGGAGNNTLIATSNNVTAVYWSSPQGVNVNLQTGVAQNGFGGTDKLVNVQNIFGSSSNDTITGNTQNNNFAGLGGSDRIVGGGGYDVVSYFFSKSTDATISYDVATDTFTIVKNFANGDKGADILQGIDEISFGGAGSDNKSIFASDFTGTTKFSLAGIWPAMINAPAQSAVVGPFVAQIPLGKEQKNGLVVDSWVYRGSFGGSGDVTKVNVGILEQQADGTLKLATRKYVSDSVTNGAGSVNIADFNGDGQADIFLAAHNESPFVAMPSTAYLSNKSGTFDKITLTDAVMAHDAQLSYVNGKPTIFTRTFQPGDANASYQFIDGKFVETKENFGSNWISGGMSVAVADFNNDGKYEIAIGDFDFGPGYPNLSTNKWVIGLYALDDIQKNTGKPLNTITPYFSNNAQYKNTASEWGVGWTHSYRLWTDDFNHDGLMDIIAGQSLWSQKNPEYPSVLQMLQNKGDFQFTDVTDQLNQSISLSTEEFDYNMQRIDLDHSGIQSYLSGRWGANISETETRAPNYVILNDGTGQLHVALHTEFIELTKQVHRFLLNSDEVASAGLRSSITSNPNSTDNFVAYQLPDGALNFVAITNGTILTNVPLHYDIRTDYKTDVQIGDRNQSKLMRTWAGNDTISDHNANTMAHIDGGLGMDTATYSKAMSDYQLNANQDGSFSVIGSGIRDTVVNIEKLQFGETSVYLGQGINIAAGSAAADQFLGSAKEDLLRGGGGNDVIDGGLGNDTAMYAHNLSAYQLHKKENGYHVDDKTIAEGSDTLVNVERLQFADMTVNLTVQASASAMPSETVQRLIELYIAFFNRTPDADGMAYWMSEVKAGMTLNQVSEAFYSIGASDQFAALTGFSKNMTNDDFINTFYKNVLGRSEGADAGGLAYWRDSLASGKSTRGSLAQDILNAAHTFKGDAAFGYVADLLDNKYMVGKTVAIDWGINYNEDAYTHGVEIAKAVTSNSMQAALDIVGVHAADILLT